MLGAVFDLARPLLFALDPERAHELTLKSLEAGIYPRSFAADDARLAAQVWGLAFSEPVGHCRRLRQGRTRVRLRTRHGAGLRRGGHCHPSATGRQFAPARIPAHRGSRADQPAGLQQRGACGDAGAARARARRGASSASTSAPTRTRPIAPPTMWRASVASMTWRATSPSTSPRPTRRACATCKRRPRSTISWRACWRHDRSWWRRASRSARSWSSWLRILPRTTWRRWSMFWCAERSTASPSAIRHSPAPACAMPLSRRRPAGSRAARCFTAPP